MLGVKTMMKKFTFKNKSISTLLISLTISISFLLSACTLNGSQPTNATVSNTTSIITTQSDILTDNTTKMTTVDTSTNATTTTKQTTPEPTVTTTTQPATQATTTSLSTTTAPATTTTVPSATTATKPVTTTTKPATTTTPTTTTTKPITTTTATTTLSTNFTPISGFAYGYDNLSSQHKAVYNEIMLAFENYETPININHQVTVDDFKNLFELVKNNALRYHYIPNQFSYSYDRNTNLVTQLLIEYTHSKSQSQTMITELDNKIEQIISGITPQMNQFDRLKYLHDSIIKICTYDLNAPNAHTAYGALVDGAAVCEGYSKAMTLLCNRIGIESILVTGYGNGQDHMWNMIKYNGNWYHMDVTWDDPISTFGGNYIQYDYFNITTAQVKLDHTRIDTNAFYTIPNATATEGNYFIKTGTYATSYDEAVAIVKRLLINAGNAKEDHFSFKLATQTLYNSTYDKLFTKVNGTSLFFEILSECVGSSSNKFKINSYSKSSNQNPQNVITIFISY